MKRDSPALLLRQAVVSVLGLCAPLSACCQAKAPDISQSLNFVANGLEHDFAYKSYGEEKVSSSTMKFELLQDGKDASLGVTQVTTDRSCVLTQISTVLLSNLDPGNLNTTNQPWGIFLSVGTTDGTKKVLKASSAEGREGRKCVAAEPFESASTLLLRFDDPAYRDRALKAMRHAIELAGGKTSAF